MRDINELNAGCAAMLRELRERHGLSKAAMAEELFINPHTWASWESGRSSPTLPEFISAFNAMHEDVLPVALKYLYPEQFAELSPADDFSNIKEALLQYISSVASERIIRELSFILFGGHGSNVEPQLQMFTAINHLPLTYRIIVCENVLSMYGLAEFKDELRATDKIMPNIEYMQDAIEKAKMACRAASHSYTTAIK